MKRFMLYLSVVIAFISVHGSLTAGETAIKTGNAKIVTVSQPEFGTITLDTEEIVILKESEKNDNFMFKGITSMIVDAQGDVYLLDTNRILKYRADGEFLKPIGRLGQGPGEYLYPRNLFIDSGGNLYINDGQKLVQYDKTDGFVKNIPINSMIWSKIFVDEKGNIHGVTREFGPSGAFKALTTFTQSGERRSIASFQDREIHVIGNKSGGGVMGGVSHVYSFDILFSPLLDDKLCFANNLDYDIYICDLEGNVQLVIKNKEKIQEISREEMKEFEKLYSTQSLKFMKFPSNRPFLERLLTDPKGRIYAVRKKSVLDQSRDVSVDIYSKTGRFLYTTKFSYLSVQFGDGFYYVVDTDENNDDKVSIKKVIIKNYNELRF